MGHDLHRMLAAEIHERTSGESGIDAAARSQRISVLLAALESYESNLGRYIDQIATLEQQK